jgi:hypothetical protein
MKSFYYYMYAAVGTNKACVRLRNSNTEMWDALPYYEVPLHF